MQVIRRLTIVLVPLLFLGTATAGAPGFGKPITLARGIKLWYDTAVTLATSDEYVYAAWDNNASTGDVFFRRLHTDGSTAGGIHRISNAPTRGLRPALAANGKDVALAWIETWPVDGDPVGGRVVFRRSHDGGQTWKAPVVIAQMNHNSAGASPAVAVYGDTLAIVYTKLHDVWLRTSRDAGKTWTPPVQVNAPGGEAGAPDVFMDAEGIYVTYTVDPWDGYIFFRKTVDFAHWQSPVLVGRGLESEITGGAHGIVVVWTRLTKQIRHGKILSRRSLDHGGQFGSTRIIAGDGPFVLTAALASTSGGVAAAWAALNGLWVSTSANGRDWEPARRVEPRAMYAFGPALAGSTRLWLGYFRQGERFKDVVVRRGR